MDLNRDVKDGMIVFLIICVGILLAVALGVMHEGGVLVDEFTAGSQTITLANIQAAVIIFFMLFGAIFIALRR